MEQTAHFDDPHSREFLAFSPKRHARFVPWKSRFSISFFPAAFMDGESWTAALSDWNQSGGNDTGGMTYR